MKAALYRTHGGVDVLEVTDVADPVPGPGEVVVAVRATSLNRLDVLQREGPPLLPGFQLPHIAGMDVAGEIVAVGADVHRWQTGTRVRIVGVNARQCELDSRGRALADLSAPACLAQTSGRCRAAKRS